MDEGQTRVWKVVGEPPASPPPSRRRAKGRRRGRSGWAWRVALWMAALVLGWLAGSAYFG